MTLKGDIELTMKALNWIGLGLNFAGIMMLFWYLEKITVHLIRLRMIMASRWWYRIGYSLLFLGFLVSLMSNILMQ